MIISFAKQLISNFKTLKNPNIKQFLGLGPSQVDYTKRKCNHKKYVGLLDKLFVVASYDKVTV